MTTTISFVPLQALQGNTPDKFPLTGPYILVKAATVAQQMQVTRSLNKQELENSEPETLRCKRRIDFTGLGYSLPRAQPATVSRRNERERNRVKMVNNGFETLREHVPTGRKNKKMSKVETLRAAVDYIKQLQEVLEDNDAVTAAFNVGLPSDVSHHSVQFVPSAGHSRSPSMSSDSSNEPLSPEEEELLDFTNWF